MKTLILIVSIFASGAAFAIDENSSWSEIRMGNTYYVDTPAINFRGGGLQTTPFGVCVVGDSLRTKRMVEKCVEWGGRDNDCQRSVYQYEYLPITRTVRSCVKRRRVGDDYECVKWANRTVTTPLSYTFDVYKRYGRDGDNHRYLFSKDYDITSCQ